MNSLKNCFYSPAVPPSKLKDAGSENVSFPHVVGRIDNNHPIAVYRNNFSNLKIKCMR